MGVKGNKTSTFSPGFDIKGNGYPFMGSKSVKVGNNMAIPRKIACMVVTPVRIDNFPFFFNCTTVSVSSE